MWLTHPFYHTISARSYNARHRFYCALSYMTHFSCISRKIDLIERVKKKTNYQWAPFSRIIWFSKWNMQILYQRYQDCLHRQITFSKLHTFFSCLSCCFGQKAFIFKRILFFKFLEICGQKLRPNITYLNLFVT